MTPEQVVHAPTPARLLTDFHNKHVLVVGQEYRKDIAREYLFTCINILTRKTNKMAGTLLLVNYKCKYM